MSLLENYESKAQPWLDRVATLAPLVEEHRAAIEAERRMPQPVFEAMRNADLFRMWLPQQYGGFESDLVTTRLVIEAVARLDGSAGWYVSILNEAAALAAYLPEDGAEEVFRDRNALVAGGGAPPGKATRVEGGHLVTGTWALASGSPHATWLFGSAAEVDGDAAEPRRPASEDVFRAVPPSTSPTVYAFAMRAEECKVLDTWYSTGLRGSGSHHIQAENVFVPEHRRFSLTSGRRISGSIYPEVYVRMLSPNHAAVGLGVALGALDAFKQLARSKPASRGQPPLSDQGAVHALIGRSEVRLHAARLALHDASVQTQEQLASAGDLLEERFLLNGLVSAHVAAEATDVVSQLYTAGGSTSLYQTNRLDRALRDVHTANQHLSTGPANFAQGGKYLLTANGGHQ
ncbi:MAG TPA: acyl-CoA dehydrogenase family protein [Dehalococcoidia bacterium]|nr:acyl-CoA dehydrogenase family protein [Dehalococcoidia bacterium]